MTISSKVSSATLNGNGAATSFPFAFKVFQATQLEVWITDSLGVTTKSTNWSATLTENGGAVLYPVTGSPLPAGHKITVLRNMDFKQGLDLVNATAFQAQVIEEAFDNVTMQIQQLKESGERCVIYPAGTPIGSVLNSADFLNATTANVAAAQAAQVSAEAAQGLAEGARTSAQGFALSAGVSADDCAEDALATASDRVAVASDKAIVAADKATTVAAKDTAVSAKDTTLAARDTAVSAKDTAVAAAVSAGSSASAASSSNSAATASASSAAASETLASEYSNYPEDSQIPGHAGEYSAKHYAAKAAAAASGGAVKVSSNDTTPGYLETKILPGSGVAMTTQNDGAAETCTLAMALASNPGLEFSSGLLRVKASTGLTLSPAGLAVDAGTTAGKLVQLDANAKLPALDGSQLLNIPTNMFNKWTIATRPATPVVGLFGLNTELNEPEWWDAVNGRWVFMADHTIYSIDFLVVAGGGAASGSSTNYNPGGAGGGGGYRCSKTGENSGGGAPAESKLSVQGGQSFTVIVGAGGVGTTSNAQATSGSDSSLGSIIALGGGAGAAPGTGAGKNGGSGGGSCYPVSGGRSSGTAGQGFRGGLGADTDTSGPGGGAGAVGADSVTGTPSPGGDGVQSSISGTPTFRAGGGGGGKWAGIGALGGLGGGGNAGQSVSSDGLPGAANTGGGGGSCCTANSGAKYGGNGGSGVVIIAYPGPQRGTGGTYTYVGGYSIHTFTTSGTYAA